MEHELYHYGVLGMKWGIRRYQNEDGSLTPLGRKRLAEGAAKLSKSERELARAKWYNRAKYKEKRDRAANRYEDLTRRLSYNKMSDEDLLKASKDFKVTSSYTSIATGQNVKTGERSLEDKIKLGGLILTTGITAIKLLSAAREFGWSAQDRKTKSDAEAEKKEKSNDQDNSNKQKNSSKGNNSGSSDNSTYWKLYYKDKASERSAAQREANKSRRNARINQFLTNKRNIEAFRAQQKASMLNAKYNDLKIRNEQRTAQTINYYSSKPFDWADYYKKKYSW
jgi:hypothetical protein